MKEAGYLTIDEIVPKNFLEKPQVVMVEAGNGMGKTHAAAEYAVSLQKIGIFDRIYIVEYSQKGCENAVNKIVKFGGWAIWHIGLEKFCPFFNKMRDFVERGLPPSWLCYTCRYFQNKARMSFMRFVEQIKSPNKTVILPEYADRTKIKPIYACTHPIIRSYVLDPTMDSNINVNTNETPIIVVPVQLFFNHSIIGKWRRFASRQKKDRKVMLIIDEADTAFFSSLKVEVPLIELTEDDYDLLREFSPKSKDLSELLDLYQEYYKIIQEIYKNRNIPTKQHIEKINAITNQASDLLRSFDRRKKQIVKFVLENNIETNIFKAITALEELTHLENVNLALKTIETDGDKYVLYDYDYGVKLLFDVTYPWKYFWKINLSATFPTESIVKSRYVSNQGKRVMMGASRRSKSYNNVYVSTVNLFEKTEGILNRNKELEFIVPKILKAIRQVIETYTSIFGDVPNGVSLWFGNSKQMRTFIKKTKAMRVNIKVKGRYAQTAYRGIPIFISYLGSPISRGIDLDTYDISIVVSPLLRPPRHIGFLDVIDFAKAISEVVQGAMRITRAPSPKKPKLIVLESTMTTGFYSMFYPEWFKKLFSENFIELQ